MPTRGQMGVPHRREDWDQMQADAAHVATSEHVERRDTIPHIPAGVSSRKPVIISRHAAAVAFVLRERPGLATATVMASATADDVRGRVVYGNLPLHLAALAREVWAIEFDGDPPRGAEYGLPEMDAAGAVLRRYVVCGDARLRGLAIDGIDPSGYPW